MGITIKEIKNLGYRDLAEEAIKEAKLAKYVSSKNIETTLLEDLFSWADSSLKFSFWCHVNNRRFTEAASIAPHLFYKVSFTNYEIY